MESAEKRKQLVETGLELLRSGLVARTWGNVSSRLDDSRFLITPSGLDYTKTTEADIAVYDRLSGTWEGPRKPSSEKGIHAAAYELFPDVNFVIHTHQTYATALGLVGWDSMDVSEQEKSRLGGLARAEYGLPGQKSLRENVRKAMQTGAQVVFMVNHGVVICGASREDAMEKAELLEKICKRNYKGGIINVKKMSYAEVQKLMEKIKSAYPNALAVCTDELVAQANSGKAIPAQLDDMAQMIGLKIAVTKNKPESIIKALGKRNAVLVPRLGAVVCGRDEDDSQALCLLAQKSAVSARHCKASGAKIKLPLGDAVLMKIVYDMKYSKQKG